MSKERQKGTVEISAPTLDEAIEQGLEQLGITKDEAYIQILQEGGRGLLGLRAQQAKVRIQRLDTEEEEEKEEQPQDEVAAADIADIAKETLIDLTKAIGIDANVSIREIGGTSSSSDTPPVILDVTGNDDLDLLIGPQGQSLWALQFITRCIVSRDAEQWIRLVVDVDHYKQDREETLRDLAQRMAEYVKLEKRPVSLKPMPPHERRIIHITLRDNPSVTTYSIGEEGDRKVTIRPT